MTSASAYGVADFARSSVILAPQLATGVLATSGFDLRGLRGVVLSLAVGIWSSGTFTLKVQHADPKADGTAPSAGDYVDVVGGALTVTHPPQAQEKKVAIRSASVKSFVRFRIEGPSGNPGVTAFALALDPYGDPTAESWDLEL